ncbi:hypothetical protein FBU31_002229, partial [Coemansia sp. 'formosensis']
MTTTTTTHASMELSEADSSALTAFLRHTSEQAADGGTMTFDSMLWTYLHSAPTADGDNSPNAAQLLHALINCNDKYTQANVIYRLGRLETTDPRTFVTSVCHSAITEFWNYESSKAVDSDNPSTWVVEWALPKETGSIIGIDAWRAWWRQSAMLREL